MDDVVSYLQHRSFSVLTILIVAILAYVFGATIVSWLTKRALYRAYRRKVHKRDLQKRQKTMAGLVVNVWRVAIVIVACLAIARLFVSASTLTPLFASAGIFGVALGFGAQSLIKDFLSGIFIITENQYRVGDVIEIEGFSGTVERIGARSTVIRDVEGNVHYFPNGIIQHVINKTMDYSIARVIIAVTPDTNLDLAEKIINTIGEKMSKDKEWEDRILTAPTYNSLGEISATALNLIVSGKVPASDQWAVSAELKRRILEAFEKADIELGLTATTGTVITRQSK